MPQSDIQKLLNSFAPIQLTEMERVMLMNRIESKYLFPVSKLPVLLEELSEHYKILDIDTIRTFPYRTIYLDTSDSFVLHPAGERQAKQAQGQIPSI